MNRVSDIEPDFVFPAAADTSRLGQKTGPSVRLKSWSRQRSSMVVAGLLLLVLLIAFWPVFEAPANQMDEGMLLVYPEQLLQGKFPYRDFETFYGPASPGVLAVAYAIAGTNIFVERSVGLLYRILILLAVFAIAKNWGKTLAAGCLFLTGCLLLGTALPAYAWLGAVACALWSLWLGHRGVSDAHCFFGGLLAGCALLFRVDLGPAIILSALPLLYAMTLSRKWKYLAGIAIALFPLGFLTLFAGWRPVWENLFLFPVIHSSPGRHLPFFSAAPFLQSLFFAHSIAVAINVAAGLVAVRSPTQTDRGRLLLGVALFGLGLTHQAVQRLDAVHLLFALFVSLGILPVSLAVLWSRLCHRPAQTAEVSLAVVAVIAVVQAIAPELTLYVRRFIQSRSPRRCRCHICRTQWTLLSIRLAQNGCHGWDISSKTR